MKAKLKFEKEWKPALDEATTRGDLRLEMYDVVREVLDKHIKGYYEEESNKQEIVGGNEYVSWSVYVIEDDKVYAYDIETALYWDGTCRVSIEGPREVDDEAELENVLYLAEEVGNDDDVRVVKKLIEEVRE